MIIVGIIGKLCNDITIHIILLTYRKLWVMPYEEAHSLHLQSYNEGQMCSHT